MKATSIGPGLCHGATGLGFIYHRLDSGIGDDVLAHAARAITYVEALRDNSIKGGAGHDATIADKGGWRCWRCGQRLLQRIRTGTDAWALFVRGDGSDVRDSPSLVLATPHLTPHQA